MKSTNHNRSGSQAKALNGIDSTPFETAEELWFWFIAAQAARNDGARYVSGASVMRRPCEPVDILKIMDDLYRKRRLVRDHLLVLRHYGRRYLAPEPNRTKEVRAYYLWTEALERMEPVFLRKGLIEKEMPFYVPTQHRNHHFMVAAE